MRRPTIPPNCRRLLLGIAIGITSLGASADPILNRAVESAQTSADHAALAAFYRDLAAEEGERAKQHRALADAYRRRGRASFIRAPENHCKTLARLSEARRAKYEALAKEHEAQTDD